MRLTGQRQTQRHEQALALGPGLVLHRCGPGRPGVGVDGVRQQLQGGGGEGRILDHRRDRPGDDLRHLNNVAEFAEVALHRVPEGLAQVDAQGFQARLGGGVVDPVHRLGVQAIQIGRVVARGRTAHLGEGEGGAQVCQRSGDFQIVRGADLAQVAGDGDRLIAVGAHVHDGQREQRH
uniref:LigA n=1 Tax=Parastrongyloides trichosuri TaxID=131310 RepID=A0A0N5A6W9_PARTI